MLPIPLNVMLRASLAPFPPVISPFSYARKHSLPPRCFSELEVADLEGMLAPHSPSIRKSSLKDSEISLLNNFDLEAMIPKNHYVRRYSNQYQEISVSDYPNSFDNKQWNSEDQDLTNSTEKTAMRISVLP